MARPLRIEYAGAWYYVTNRCLRGKCLFADQEDRELFSSLLADLQERYSIEVHAYSLLNDRYHLLVHTPQVNLARAMRHLHGVYTQSRNRRLNIEGSVFRGRYRSVIIEADEYLLPLTAFIHLQSLDGEQSDGAWRYKWSSCSAYVGDAPVPEWLNTWAVFAALGGAQRQYRLYLQTPIDDEIKAFFQRERYSPILGTAQFVREVLQGYTGQTRNAPDLRGLFSPPTLEALVDSITQVWQVSDRQLYEARRGRLNIPRMMAVYLSHRRVQLSLSQVAEHFGMNHYTSAASAVQRYERLKGREQHVQRMEASVIDCLERQQVRQYV